MNFQPLFTTARVVTALYRVLSTTLLLMYLTKRVYQGRRVTRNESRSEALREITDH